jgi:hypothetical protein
MLLLSLIFRRWLILIVLVVVPLLVIGMHHSSYELSDGARWRCPSTSATFAFPSPIWFALVWMAAINCMFLVAYPPMVATFCCGWGRCSYGSAKATLGTAKMVGVWLHHSPMLALVHHCSNLAAPGFLAMVGHNFVVHLLLGSWKNLLLILYYFFPLPAQEVLPLTDLLPLKKKF